MNKDKKSDELRRLGNRLTLLGLGYTMWAPYSMARSTRLNMINEEGAKKILAAWEEALSSHGRISPLGPRPVDLYKKIGRLQDYVDDIFYGQKRLSVGLLDVPVIGGVVPDIDRTGLRDAIMVVPKRYIGAETIAHEIGHTVHLSKHPIFARISMLSRLASIPLPIGLMAAGYLYGRNRDKIDRKAIMATIAAPTILSLPILADELLASIWAARHGRRILSKHGLGITFKSINLAKAFGTYLASPITTIGAGLWAIGYGRQRRLKHKEKLRKAQRND